MNERFETQKNEMSIVTPICKICKNKVDFYMCKYYEEIPKKYRMGESYKCRYVTVDKDSPFLEFITPEILGENKRLRDQLFE